MLSRPILKFAATESAQPQKKRKVRSRIPRMHVIGAWGGGWPGGGESFIWHSFTLTETGIIINVCAQCEAQRTPLLKTDGPKVVRW
jgi:hypothetical protein